jgi:multimeric flavodoxin WrbA
VKNLKSFTIVNIHMRITAISTTTHKFDESASSAVIRSIMKQFKQRGHSVKIINADKLHIVKNLSCYSGGGTHCAAKDSGPYRCWAHKESHENPEKYGGKDQMSVIYDAFEKSDVIIFCTSVRWMSHTALMQTIIERMNTLENRVSVYGEKSPLAGKKCGVITVGQHYKSQEVAEHIMEVMGFMGFDVPPDAIFAWQKTLDLNKEQGNKSNKEYVKKYLDTESGEFQIKQFIDSLDI